MKHTKRIIGITGGVGSGKSEVLSYLKKNYNAHIILSDDVAKNITSNNLDVIRAIDREFSGAVINDRVDNNKLSQIVFNDKSKLFTLNKIVHPATIKAIIDEIKESDSDIVIVESAILIGSDLESELDEIWWIYCNRNIRINRLMQSRGYTREKCLEIINNQMSDEEFNKNCDEYIDNSEDFDKTKEQIDLILSELGYFNQEGEC